VSLERFRPDQVIPSDQERSKRLDDRNAIQNLPFHIGYRRTLSGVRPIRRALRHGWAIRSRPCLQREQLWEGGRPVSDHRDGLLQEGR
jgi:hypothetical protein